MCINYNYDYNTKVKLKGKSIKIFYNVFINISHKKDICSFKIDFIYK